MAYIVRSSKFALYPREFFLCYSVLPYLLKSRCCINTYILIMNQYDLKFDFKINVGHNDLNFMVQ